MPSNESILDWNFANWLTVGLMALTLFFALGFLQKYLQGRNANAGS